MKKNLTFILWAFFFIKFLFSTPDKWFVLMPCHEWHDVALVVIAMRHGRDQIWPTSRHTYCFGSLGTSVGMLPKKEPGTFHPFPAGHSSDTETGLAIRAPPPQFYYGWVRGDAQLSKRRCVWILHPLWSGLDDKQTDMSHVMQGGWLWCVVWQAAHFTSLHHN